MSEGHCEGEQQAQAGFPSPAFIEPPQMRELLLANKECGGGGGDGKKDLQVVDVRGSDFTGRKLPGAINVPTDEFKEDERVDRLVEELKGKDLVVFHCGKSQQRGPFTAARFLSRLNAAAAASGDCGGKLPEVAVLKDGFEGWLKLYGEEDGMVEPVDVAR